MNYYFTGMLVILFVVLCFVKPAYPRNEYLNDGTNTCSTGSFDVSVEQRDSDYYHRSYCPSNDYDNFNDDRSIRLTYRKYLGSACTDRFKDIQQENMELKQQLELMKMCGKVNRNPTLKYNPNFHLLVMKCSGIVINDEKQERPEGSAWGDLTDEYKDKPENKDKTFMSTKNIMLPPKDFKLPEPK